MINSWLDSCNWLCDGLPSLSFQCHGCHSWMHGVSAAHNPNECRPRICVQVKKAIIPQFSFTQLGAAYIHDCSMWKHIYNFPFLIGGQLWRTVSVPDLPRYSPEARGTCISMQILLLSTHVVLTLSQVLLKALHSKLSPCKFPFQGLFPQKKLPQQVIYNSNDANCNYGEHFFSIHLWTNTMLFIPYITLVKCYCNPFSDKNTKGQKV